MSNEKSEKSEMNETERKELVASKMKEFQQMMPTLANSIVPMVASVSEQLTTDLSDLKKGEIALYRGQEDMKKIINQLMEKIINLEKAINALQRQGT